MCEEWWTEAELAYLRENWRTSLKIKPIEVQQGIDLTPVEATGAVGPVDWPETPKGLNGPAGPWIQIEPLTETLNRTIALLTQENTDLRAELATLRTRAAERDAAVVWAIKRGR